MPSHIARVVVCIGLVGCGFSAKPAGSNNDSPVDASGGGGGGDDDAGSGSDAGSDASTTTQPTCLQMWMDGSVKLGTPAPLSKQSDANVTERDPWISKDGLHLYYANQKTGGSETSDIFLATRENANAAFGTGTIVNNLSTSTFNESRPAFTPDEKVAVIASNRNGGGGGGQYNILYAMADQPGNFGTPDMNHMSTIDSTSGDHFDPFLSPDALRLYFAPFINNGQHIYLASRGQTSNDFSSAAIVPIINGTGGVHDADPSLSLDEKIIVFTSDRGGNNDLYFAVRTDVGQQFGLPKPIPNVNSANLDGDPMLSADTCTLYFASTRGPGDTYDLYSAAVIR